MNKLTAEKCREQIDDCIALKERGYLSINGEYKLQALEIALPILEQQDHEKSIIAGQLESVRGSLSLTPHQDAVISCAIDRLNVLTLRTLELSQSLIKQQERGEGWIEWGGGERPVHAHVKVEVKHRDSLCASTVSRAHDFDWSHYGYKFGPDIIAYRIIPERATNQNGEQ